jgi:rRNA maturation protein Nop10
MRRDFKVEKLSDEFGQYELISKCEACGHERRALPRSLANICGWDAKLEDVTLRLRCSKCGERRCTARPLPATAPHKPLKRRRQMFERSVGVLLRRTTRVSCGSAVFFGQYLGSKRVNLRVFARKRALHLRPVARDLCELHCHSFLQPRVWGVCWP